MKSRETLIEEMEESIEYGSKVLVTGGGGVGKTYMMNQLSEKYDIIKTSSTGVSSILLNGQTSHSFFRLGYSTNIAQLDYNDEQFCKNVGIASTSLLLGKLKRTIASADVILIDEISMIPKNILEMIMYRLYQMNFNDFPLILSGDFLQLPPVNGQSLIHDPELLSAFKIKNMNKIFRSDDHDFVRFLNSVRIGKYTEFVHNYISNNLLNKEKDPHAVKIFATNREVELLNTTEYNKLKTEEVEYKYTITLEDDEVSKNKRAIETFVKNAKIGDIKLKVGCRVILIKNLNDVGLVNGDTGTVARLYNNSISVNFDRVGVMNISYESFDNIEYVTENDTLKKNILWTVRAIPLMISYALTIHKAQGSSIENLEIHADNIFTQSQLYVALSRSSNPKKLNLISNDTSISFLKSHINNVFDSAKDFYLNMPDDCQYE